MSFLRDFEKVNPKQEEKQINLDEEKNIPNITFQDMKDYFDGLKESISAEMRKEMLDYINNSKVTDNVNNGNNEIEKEE